MNRLTNPEVTPEAFADTLIRWYEHHKRDLPWRHTRDPYRIWLSEIILQQTRVAQGLPYYQRFVQTYPTVGELAAADERDLLRLWQGLGYYSRARNLHQTARLIVTRLNGHFPETYAELLQLRGIGAYTAAAIASFAFGEKVAVVDGNVYRVLARIFGIEDDIRSTGAKKTFQTLADQLIRHTNQPDAFNQGIMEFGAIQCTPVSPDCLLCPFQTVCVAFQTGRQAQLPVKSPKAAVRERYFHYLVVESDEPETRMAMQERTGRDVWQGLYDFPVIETDEPTEAFRDLPSTTLSDYLLREARFSGPPVRLNQLLSHQRIRATFWPMRLSQPQTAPFPDTIHLYKISEIEQLPKPLLIVKYLKSRFK